MLAGMWRFRTALAIALCGCASYRVLPSPAPATGLSPLPVRYEETHLGLFHSVKDDGAFERVFIDPATFAVSLYDRAGQALSRQRLEETSGAVGAEDLERKP